MTDNTLDTINAQLQTLLTWPDGWNTYNAKAPNPTSVSSAIQWITTFYHHITSTNQQWLTPNITGGGDGEVVIGWRQGQRKLDVYVDENDISYLQVDGKGMNAPMYDGDIKSINDMQELWQWLLEGYKENEAKQ